jgi:hypothetical protein
MKRSIQICVALVGLFWGAAAYAITSTASEYGLTLIARQYDYKEKVFYKFYGTPVIAGDGTVYWHGWQVIRGKTTIGIFRYREGKVSVVFDIEGEYAEFDSLAVNEENVLAFEAVFDTGRYGVFRWDGEKVATIADNDDRLKYFHGISINRDGTVAFRASNSATGEVGVYVGAGKSLTKIAGTKGDFAQISRDTSINDSGHVLFFARPPSGNYGLYAWNGTTVDELYSRKKGFFITGSWSGVDDDGKVVFVASTDESTGIYIGDGGTPKLFLNSNEQFSGIRDVNSHFVDGRRMMAFCANGGVFVGTDPAKDKVIARSDSFLNTKVVETEIGRGLNESGQIAMIVRLHSRRARPESTLVLATPVNR